MIKHEEQKVRITSIQKLGNKHTEVKDFLKVCVCGFFILFCLLNVDTNFYISLYKMLSCFVLVVKKKVYLGTARKLGL